MKKRGAVYLAVAGASSLALASAYVAFPAARPHLMREDDFLEWLTALTFAAGVASGFVSFFRRAAPWPQLLVPTCSLLGLLDELSFGERWLGLAMPTLRKLPVDGVHDLFLVAYDVVVTDKPLFLGAYAAAAMVGVAAVAWLLRPGSQLRARARAAFEHAPVPYVAWAVVLLVFALVLDLDLIENEALVFLEELLELQLALALVFAGLAIGGVSRGPAALAYTGR